MGRNCIFYDMEVCKTAEVLLAPELCLWDCLDGFRSSYACFFPAASSVFNPLITCSARSLTLLLLGVFTFLLVSVGFFFFRAFADCEFLKVWDGGGVRVTWFVYVIHACVSLGYRPRVLCCSGAGLTGPFTLVVNGLGSGWGGGGGWGVFLGVVYSFFLQQEESHCSWG